MRPDKGLLHHNFKSSITAGLALSTEQFLYMHVLGAEASVRSVTHAQYSHSLTFNILIV